MKRLGPHANVGGGCAYSMVGFEVVDLLPEYQHPQVLAEKLDHI
jgi:hypothetical protein